MAFTQHSRLSAHAELVYTEVILQQPWGDCPRQISTLLKLSTDVAGVQDEEDSDVEVYLLFSNNILPLFQDVVQVLEANGSTFVELYSIMHSFIAKLTQK